MTLVERVERAAAPFGLGRGIHLGETILGLKGRVAFEAGIHGLIPIVAARGGLPEMVAFGERGLVFDPDRPETLRDALSTVIERDSFRRSVRQRWEVDKIEYEPATVAMRTLAIYEKVLEKRVSLAPVA